MRWCVALALISTFLSSNALAADKGKNKKKNAKSDTPAATLDNGNDPAKTEKSDQGPYAPRGTTGALAEEEREEEAKNEQKEIIRARPRDKHVVFADGVIGFGQAPIPAPATANTTPSSDSFGLIVGGTFDFSRSFTLGLRIPWSVAAVERADRTAKDSSTAFGTPELYGEYRVYLSDLTSLPILLGVGAPLAQGNPDPSSTSISKYNEALVNLIADAASGWRDGELYAPKRVPLVLGVGIRYERKSLEVHGYTKLVAGINTGPALVQPDVYGGTGHLVEHSVSLRSVTLAGIKYEFLSKPILWGALDTWLVYNPIEPINFESDATPPTRFQLVAEPRIGARFGKLSPSVGYIFPIGGRLADSGISGVHLRIEYAL